MNKDRAKIFSSFNPLSTLEKALKAQEREKSEKLDLDEFKIEEILNKISKLKPADKVKITYHDGQGYVSIEGLVSGVNCFVRRDFCRFAARETLGAAQILL